MHRKFYVVFLLLFLGTIAFSQADSTPGPARARQVSQNYFMTFQLAFSDSPYGTTFRAKGLVASVGFNPAKFFSNHLILGITADAKLIPGVARVSASDAFISDFNAAYFVPENSPKDAANAQTIYTSVNSKTAIRGTNELNIGCMFSLFPQTYGGVLIQVKRGRSTFNTHEGVYENAYVEGGKTDKWFLGMHKNWKVEATIKPAAFFRNTYINRKAMSGRDFIRSFTLSFFYERVNFQSASFNGTAFSQFLSPEFMAKYRYDNRFGFKIGFSLY